MKGASDRSARPRSTATTRRALLWALAIALFVPGTGQAISEYKVKAAFLLNFGKFVEWPSRAGNLEICVIGNDPFGSTLDDTLAGRSIGKRSVTARRIKSAKGARKCSILFVSREGSGAIDSIVNAMAGSPVLLVGEQDRFATRGGMINFVEVDQKIRFEINEGAAKRVGLKISSQLLKLATIVDGG